MSQAQVEQFADRVKNDPEMYQKLIAGSQSAAEVADKAVALGRELGFSFTRDEANTFIQSQLAAGKNGDLSDLQLESVAGGGGKIQTATKTTASTAIEITDYGFGVSMPVTTQ